MPKTDGSIDPRDYEFPPSPTGTSLPPEIVEATLCEDDEGGPLPELVSESEFE